MKTESDQPTVDGHEMEQQFKASVAANSVLVQSIDAMSEKVRKLEKYEASYKRSANKKYRNVAIQVQMKDKRDQKEMIAQHMKQTSQLQNMLQQYLVSESKRKPNSKLSSAMTAKQSSSKENVREF